MKQHWKDLFFIHYTLPKKLLQAVLPHRIKCDTLNGVAFIGVVGFTMEKTLLRGPPFLSYPSFHELNLRTYVTLPSGKRAVYFFSLDANSKLAVLLARRLYKLNYFYSQISYSYEGSKGKMAAQLSSSEVSIHEFQIGKPYPTNATAEFLVERYCFMTEKKGRYYIGQLSHNPYQLSELSIESTDLMLLHRTQLLEDSLTVFPQGCYYCKGFDVDVVSFSQVYDLEEP